VGTGTRLSRYEEAWEAINRLIRRGGSWSGHERNCFYVQNEQGEFENVSAVCGLDVVEDGRGLAVFDFDRDGDQDLILKSRNAPQVRLWRNDSPRGNSLIELALEGKASNRQAIGARVTVKAGSLTRVKEVCAGCGFLSQNTSALFFGLGKTARVDSLEVRWPSGGAQLFRDVEVNRLYRLREGESRLDGREFFSTAPGRALVSGPTFAAAASSSPAGSSGAQVWLIDPCPLPRLKLADPSGREVKIEALGKAPLLLSFWSPDCPRCRAELDEWSRDRAAASAGGKRSEPELVTVTRLEEGKEQDLAAQAPLAEVAGRLGAPVLLAREESLLALGVLLEEVAHWPRDLPVPTSLLVGPDGKIVKLYRGAVPWTTIAADSAAIPRTGAERLRAALPFAGKYYATVLYRNDFQLGVSYLEAGLEEEALLAFRRSLERRPDQADTVYNLGVIYQRQGRSELAREMYLEALERQPDFVDARANLGVMDAQEGRLDEAAGEFEKVLSVRKDHAESLINLGNVELARGKLEEALRSYAAAAELEPEIPQVQKKLGDAFRRMGDAQHALQAYERATRLAPLDPEAWSNLAVIQAEAGQLETALATCRKALEVDENYASAHNNLGLILQGLGKNKEAIARFRRARELAPELAPTSLNLARALLREGEEEEARAVLKALLKVHPGHPAATDLLRKMGKK
jgi:tetratricopeptide (TPR) repeat protein